MKANILVVCGRNKKRGKTAEYLFKNDVRFNIRSVGLSNESERKISEKDLKWANLILVMENQQKLRITDTYQNIKLPKIEIMGIKDKYEFLDRELCSILTNKINNIVKSVFNI